MTLTLEYLLVLALQLGLSFLVTVILRWTADIREDLREVSARLARANDAIVAHDGRLSHIEQMGDYYQEATTQRLEAVGGRASDLRDEVGRLKTIVERCPGCNHMRLRPELEG